jgi:hypothetical protein
MCTGTVPESAAEALKMLRSVAGYLAGLDAAQLSLAEIYAEIRSRTAGPDPDGRDPDLDRALSLDGAGLMRGDLTPECTALVQAVLDALAAPGGAGDLRTRPQRYHDALAEATALVRKMHRD